VLVVEDEDAVRNLTVHSLRGLGYRTCEASNAEQALAAVASNDEIALVMTDVVMPGGADGLDLAATIDARFPGTPVLVVSGYAAPSARRSSWPLLAKPYRREQLAAAVRNAIDNRWP
jgi:CheY-like chemotaxis protein